MFPFAAARSGPAETSGKSGEAGGLSSRAPRLKEGAELLVASIVKALQTMAGPTTVIEGMLAGMTLRTPRDVLSSPRADAVIGSIVIKDLSCMILIMLDSTLVHTVVEMLSGGNGVEPQPTESRAVTPIDHQFAQIVFTLAATAAQSDWADLGFESARAVKLEGMLTSDIFGARIDEVGVVDVTIGIFGLHGTLRLVLPPLVLDRFGGMARGGGLAATSSDPTWSTQLQKELGQTPVSLSAFLDAKSIPLGALAGLKVGQILALPPDARTRASLVSDGAVLYRGEIGRDDTHYSLRIDELVVAPAARKGAGRSPYFAQSKD